MFYVKKNIYFPVFGAIFLLVGAIDFVTGLAATFTSPVILITIVGFFGSLVVTVIDFVCLPFFPFVLKVALIVLDLPGLIAESVLLTAVQPQLPLTFLIFKSVFPVFVKTNS